MPQTQQKPMTPLQLHQLMYEERRRQIAWNQALKERRAGKPTDANPVNRKQQNGTTKNRDKS